MLSLDRNTSKMLPAVILIVTLWLVYMLHKWYTVWQYSEKFPGPRALPLIGNAIQIGFTSYDYMQNMVYFVKHYEFRPFRIWVGPQLYVIVTDAKDVEIILSTTKHNDKFDDYRFLYDWIGKGLITANSTSGNWFRQRKIITPTFHFNILQEFHNMMSSNLEQLVDKLDGYADSGEQFDAQRIINLATLDVICETAMGVRMNALEDENSEIVKAFHDASDVVFRRMFSWWKRSDFLFRWSDDYKRNKKACGLLRGFNQTIIEQRKQQLIEDQAAGSNDEPDDEKPKKKRAFLDILLTATFDGVALNDQEIGDEVSTFVFAGHETTTAAISIGLFNMAKYPAEQQLVYEEQIAMYGEDLSRKPTYQDLQEMKYLDMFVKESQRMHPAVALIGRRANDDLVLSNGLTVPKGTSIAIILYIMGRNPKFFENPDKFDPRRFSTENRASKNPYEFVPFSAGSRNCIGQKFANNELRLVLAEIVRHFEVLPVDEPFEPMFAMTATTHSENGIWIKLKKRAHRQQL